MKQVEELLKDLLTLAVYTGLGMAVLFTGIRIMRGFGGPAASVAGNVNNAVTRGVG